MIRKIQDALKTYWGFTDFLPLQREAVECLGGGRDCLVVLPTGGGKSLCYQAPAATLPGLAVVVSPLISLMKDQVDALNECGIPAARLDSSLPPDEQSDVTARIREGQLKLLYVAPERLVSNGFLDLLSRANLSLIAVDEAHCVSMWGHDFRPEYRQLSILKQRFPGLPVGAYTATATEQVRHDIAEQLHLREPAMLVGSFDRPNLIYKVRPRRSILQQVTRVIDRHKNESGVVYCIRRKDVDSLCEQLQQRGCRAAPYHAGMTGEQRQRNQDLFIQEKVDIIVATVAFGMGIDKSNVRYVIHTGMPKSLEHYQQESGRAGRDGLEAECWLFYSGGDYGVWKSLMRDMPEDAREIAMVKLAGMYSYCTGAVCRHRALLNYFGQDLQKDSCEACDMCMGELDCIEDGLIVAQKILSCVVRLEQRFGGAYTALVLTGSKDKRILENGHDRLTTYGLLREHPNKAVHDWIEQLVGQGCLQKAGEFNVLRLTERGVRVLRGETTPRLLQPAERKEARTSKVAAQSWEDVDRGLFEALRKLRGSLAASKGVPAYVVFGDAALRDMARRRPSTREGFLQVKGVGATKARQYGEAMLETIGNYCREHFIEMDA